MVRGLDTFKDHFRGYEDQYVLIGGTACSLAMEEAGLRFRVTEDLDIVLCIEAIKPDFVDRFWEFVRAGKYQNKQKSIGERQLYRFYNPEDLSYPAMLELFSRVPDVLSFEGEGHLIPIPMGEEASSLSAILLEDSYYSFIHAGKKDHEGLSIIGPEHIIPLKARAWLDLTTRKADGESVDSRDVKKHKNDVFRLYLVIQPDATIVLPDLIKADMSRFIAEIELEEVDLKQLGYRSGTLDEVLAGLKSIYGL